MKINRIFAIILRNLFTFRRNIERVFDAFYWPAMDLIIWGITSMYIARFSQNVSQFILLVVSGITFWLIVNRSQYETNMSLLEDIWSRNISNIFISPLKFSEWIIGVVIIGLIKSFISLFIAFIVAWILYQINFFSYGLYLVPFIGLLFMTGWWVSFLIAGTIILYGTKVQTFAWTLVTILAPFSGIYYPLSYLPQWAQEVAAILPTTYVFSGIRQVIFEHTLDVNKLWISLILNIVYLVFSIFFLQWCFKKLLKRGMLQLI